MSSIWRTREAKKVFPNLAGERILNVEGIGK